MKKIFIILSLILCACDNNENAKKSWDKMVDDMAKQEYEECLQYASKEFKDVALSDNEKTCKCVIDYIYGESNETTEIPDRFKIDFRAFLKEKCGENIPSYTLRDIPTK